MFFFHNISSIRDHVDSLNTLEVLIDDSIIDQESLIRRYSESLDIPYQNENWDGLEEDLCDLSWLPYDTICIIHHDLPNLSDRDWQIYISILYRAEGAWRGYPEKNLQIYFPAKYEGLVGQFKQKVQISIILTAEQYTTVKALLSNSPSLRDSFLRAPVKCWSTNDSILDLTLDRDLAIEIRLYLFELIKSQCFNKIDGCNETILEGLTRAFRT